MGIFRIVFPQAGLNFQLWLFNQHSCPFFHGHNTKCSRTHKNTAKTNNNLQLPSVSIHFAQKNNDRMFGYICLRMYVYMCTTLHCCSDDDSANSKNRVISFNEFFFIISWIRDILQKMKKIFSHIIAANVPSQLNLWIFIHETTRHLNCGMRFRTKWMVRLHSVNLFGHMHGFSDKFMFFSSRKATQSGKEENS